MRVSSYTVAVVPDDQNPMEKRRVAIMLNDVCSNLVVGAKILSELLHDTGCPQPHIDALNPVEQQRNETIHELLRVLSRSYFFPLSREDVHTLVSRLGDVGKTTRKCANRVSIYKVTELSGAATRLSDIFLQQVNGLATAVGELGHGSCSLKHCSEVKELGFSARDMAAGALGELFLTRVDPFILIKTRDLFRTLELAADSAKLAADWIEAITLKRGAA